MDIGAQGAIELIKLDMKFEDSKVEEAEKTIDNDNVTHKILGIGLSCVSGLLFTLNHMLIQYFKLSFSDASLVRYMMQILIISFAE